MAQATLASRIAVGACEALIIGATALAQTPPPASNSPRSGAGRSCRTPGGTLE